MTASTLIMEGWKDGIWGNHVVWHNPEDLGHAFIKIRKQSAELRIIERMDRRIANEHVVCAILGAPRNGCPI